MHNLAPTLQQQEYAEQPTEFSVPAFRADSYIRLEPAGVVNANLYEPLLSAEQATVEMGFPTGPLQAVIRLPFKQSIFIGETPKEYFGSEQYASFLNEDNEEITKRMNNVTVYCFKDAETIGHRSARLLGYYLMGLEQMKQIRDQLRYGESSLPDTSGGVLGLAPGQSVHIGRGQAGWLPNVGWDYTLLKNHDPYLRNAYQAVSHHEADAWAGDNGEFFVKRNEDSYSHNGSAMLVGVGRPLNRQ